MSYANRRKMGSNRTVAIVVVALLHVMLGYALVTGLAYNVVKKAAEDLKTFDVEDEPPPPPDEPPPPPPENQPQVPPPVVSPPPLVRTNTTAPVIATAPTAPPPQITYTAPPIIARPAPPPPPPPPPPVVKVQPAKARANLGSYFSDSDYPDDAQRNEQQGRTGFRVGIGTDGRVTDCSITSSSGSASLDAATCRILKSRARFTPATDSSGNKVPDSFSSTITWRLPAD